MAYSSYELIAVAEGLINGPSPPNSHIARAISTAYYAIFHHIGHTACELFIGGPDDELRRAKVHLMRSIEHRDLAKRMGTAQGSGMDFPKELVGFANSFCIMQKHRHDADYDTYREFTRPDAESLIADVRCKMLDFDKVSPKHRKAFLVWALLEKRAP